MADDEWRVEPRNILVGRGMGVTPERIDELQQRALKSERVNRPPPETPFSEIFKVKLADRKRPTVESDEEEEQPKNRGPSSPLNPYQRDLLGLDEEYGEDERIIVKG